MRWRKVSFLTWSSRPLGAPDFWVHMFHNGAWFQFSKPISKFDRLLLSRGKYATCATQHNPTQLTCYKLRAVTSLAHLGVRQHHPFHLIIRTRCFRLNVWQQINASFRFHLKRSRETGVICRPVAACWAVGQWCIRGRVSSKLHQWSGTPKALEELSNWRRGGRASRN